MQTDDSFYIFEEFAKRQDFIQLHSKSLSRFHGIKNRV